MCHAEAAHSLEEEHGEFFIFLCLFLVTLDLYDLRLVEEHVLSLNPIARFHDIL